MVGLFQVFKPLLDPRILRIPLFAVAGERVRRNQERPHGCEKGLNDSRLHDIPSIWKSAPRRVIRAKLHQIARPGSRCIAALPKGKNGQGLWMLLRALLHKSCALLCHCGFALMSSLAMSLDRFFW